MHTLGFFYCLKKTTIMKAKTIIFAFTLLLTLLIPQKANAQEQASGSSATFHQVLLTRAGDNRVDVLKRYLESHDSPLAAYANIFVSQADLYNIDWRLVAAIAGRESTFGKAEPCINAWGYGIYGNQTNCFASYDEGIRTISKDLREKYMNQWGAKDVYAIGNMYAASPTWASGVVYFMNDIDTFALTHPQPLPISL